MIRPIERSGRRYLEQRPNSATPSASLNMPHRWASRLGVRPGMPWQRLIVNRLISCLLRLASYWQPGSVACSHLEPASMTMLIVWLGWTEGKEESTALKPKVKGEKTLARRV